MSKNTYVNFNKRLCFTMFAVILLLSCLLIGCGKNEEPPPIDKQEKYDPLNNSFLKGVEDWVAITGSTAQKVDKVLAIRGDKCAAKKTWILPDKPDLWVDFDYMPDGKDVSLGVDIEIDGKKHVMADALPVYSKSGSMNYQIPFTMFYSQSEYGGKTATLTVTVAGSTAKQGVLIDNVITYERAIAGTIEQNDTPLKDTFDKSMEDWYIGGHFDSLKHCYQRAPVNVLHDYDKIFIEGSQLKTAPNFNQDIHTSISKYFEMPQESLLKQYQMNLQVRASDKGTLIMALCIVDGKVINVTDGWLYIHSKQESTISCAMPQGGKNAQIILMQRDSTKNGGNAEYFFVTDFSVTEYKSDPLNNRFIVDLEDWTDLGLETPNKIEVSGGYAHLKPGSVMEKTITLPVLTENYRQSFRILYASKGAAHINLAVFVDGKKTVLLDKDSLDELLQGVAMHEFDYEFDSYLTGKQVRFVFSVSGLDKNAEIKLKSFEISKKWQYDPLNNTFNDDLEDWYVVSKQGHEVNGLKFDNNWSRVYFEFLSAGDIAGKVVLGKEYKLPESQKIKLSATMEGSSAGGQQYAGYYTLQIIIDGVTYTVKDKTRISVPSHVETWKLDEVAALQGVNYSGKNVSVRLVLDANPDDQQMMAIMDNFKTEIYA